MTVRYLDLSKQGRAASLEPSSFDEATNSVEAVWTAGGIVRRRSSSIGEYDEELIVEPGAVCLARLNAGAPFLDSHRDSRLENIIGSVIPGSARIVGGKGVACIALSRAKGDRDIIHKIREGVIRSISVGYIVHRAEMVERDGQIPVMRATNWEPLEISAVAVPADAGAQIRSGVRAAPPTFPCAIIPAATAAPRATARSTYPAFESSAGWHPPFAK